MAVVYRAMMEGPDGFLKMVALKIVHSELARQPEFTRQFISEARLGGFLSHPNIVEILDYGNHKNRLFMAMELIDGPTLSNFMQVHRSQARPIPTDIVLELVIQACRGLAYVHSATDHDGRDLKLVHRDLKPSNILVNFHGSVKIADFGVARAETNLTKTLATGFIKGTGPYMSPEQAWGDQHLDHRSDLFSIGVILFELLTLEFLYDGRTLERALRQAQDADIHGRLDLLPDIPLRPQLKTLLTKALDKDPDKRFQTGDEFADTLLDLSASLQTRTTLRNWLTGMGPNWRTLPGVNAAPAKILILPGDTLWDAVERGAETASPQTHPGIQTNPSTSKQTSTPLDATFRLHRLPSNTETPQSGIGTPGTPGPHPVPAAQATTPLPVDPPEHPAPTVPPGREANPPPGPGQEPVAAHLSPTAGRWATHPAPAPFPGPTPIRKGLPWKSLGALLLIGTALGIWKLTPGLQDQTSQPPGLLDSGTPGKQSAELPPQPEASTPGRSEPSPSRDAIPATRAETRPTDEDVPPAETGGKKTGTPDGDPKKNDRDTKHNQKPPTVLKPLPTRNETEKKGFLSLNSRPRSSIMVDGRPAEGFPVRNMPLPAGEHTLVFTSENGVQLLQHVMVVDGTQQTCTALFSEGRVECRVRPESR